MTQDENYGLSLQLRSLTLASVRLYQSIAIPLLFIFTVSCRAEPEQLDVADALHAMCEDHHGKVCAMLGRLHMTGVSGETWLDRESWKRRRVMLHVEKNEEEAQRLLKLACSEGVQSACVDLKSMKH